MSVPTPEEINAMKRLTQIMSGGDGITHQEKRQLQPVTNEPGIPGSPTDDMIQLNSGPTQQDIDEMARLMGALDNNMGSMVQEAKQSPVPAIKEALNIEQTSTGIKEGSWEVQKYKRPGITKKPEDAYRVVDTTISTVAAEGMMVYEGARAITKLLNNGQDMNHKSVQEVIKMDAEYQRLREQALHEKVRWHSVKGKDTEWKQELFEAKFDVSKARAEVIKEKLINRFLAVTHLYS